MRKRNRGDLAKLEMTPMIDVVFQLLIFKGMTPDSGCGYRNGLWSR